MSISTIPNAKCLDSNQLIHSKSPKGKPDKIEEFFTKHTAIRRIALFSPLIIAGVVVADKLGPYKLLPQNYMLTWTCAITWVILYELFKHASNVERSLQDKKIERLN